MPIPDTFCTFLIEIPKNTVPNETYKTINFKIQNVDSTLELYFNGYGVENVGYVSYYIRFNNVTIPLEFSFFFTLVNTSDKKKNISCVTFKRTKSTSMGRHQFFNLNEIKTTQGYVNDGKLIFRLSKFRAISLNITPSITLNNYENIYHNMQYSDVLFKCKETYLKAHKCVLHNASCVFAEILPTVNDIISCDKNPKVMEQILSFIYTNKYDKNIFNFSNLMNDTIIELTNKNNEISNPLNNKEFELTNKNNETSNPLNDKEIELTNKNNKTLNPLNNKEIELTNENINNLHELLELCKLFKLDNFLSKIEEDISFELDDDNILIYHEIAKKYELHDLLTKTTIFINTINIKSCDTKKKYDLNNFFLCKKSTVSEPICSVF